MQKFFRVSVCVFMVISLSACFSYTPSYTYEAQANDPVIVFESDYKTHTYFSVAIENAQENRCEDFDGVGYTLNTKSIMVFGDYTPSVEINVPANQEVAITANHYFSDGSFTERCGPLTLLFVPQENRAYLARLISQDRRCIFRIIDRNDSSPVRARALSECQRK